MRQLATCDLALFVWREMAELPATLVKKKNAKSMVWVYFGLTDYQKRECEGCASPMVRSTGQCAERVRKPWCAKVGTPPTSLSIFEALHSDLHKEATQGKTDTQGERAHGNSAYTHYRHRKGKAVRLKELPAKELDCAVVYYIAKDMQPYFIVEIPGFRALVSS